MNRRVNFIVVEDFQGVFPMGNDDFVVDYKKGDTIRLLIDGKVAKKWIEKGYIKALQS